MRATPLVRVLQHRTFGAVPSPRRLPCPLSFHFASSLWNRPLAQPENLLASLSRSSIVCAIARAPGCASQHRGMRASDKCADTRGKRADTRGGRTWGATPVHSPHCPTHPHTHLQAHVDSLSAEIATPALRDQFSPAPGHQSSGTSPISIRGLQRPPRALPSDNTGAATSASSPHSTVITQIWSPDSTEAPWLSQSSSASWKALDSAICGTSAALRRSR